MLLRGLAGIGLDSIDADDVDNVCGKGRQSLLRTVGGVVSQLSRQPRQLIVTSLEQVHQCTNLPKLLFQEFSAH